MVGPMCWFSFTQRCDASDEVFRRIVLDTLYGTTYVSLPHYLWRLRAAKLCVVLVAWLFRLCCVTVVAYVGWWYCTCRPVALAHVFFVFVLSFRALMLCDIIVEVGTLIFIFIWAAGQ